jgi:pimeloyl-ACP methyl ester carboxylesterase
VSGGGLRYRAGSLVVAEGCGHDVQTDCPDIVVEAIRRVVKAANIR